MKAKVWHTAQEIADFDLPGLPTTKNGVLKRARREKWPSRPYRGHGKGKEYPLAVVLAELQLNEITPAIRDKLIATMDQLEANQKASEEVLQRLRVLLNRKIVMT